MRLGSSAGAGRDVSELEERNDFVVDGRAHLDGPDCLEAQHACGDDGILVVIAMNGISACMALHSWVSRAAPRPRVPSSTLGRQL